MSWSEEVEELHRREEMARQMGGDAGLMAQVVAASTLSAAVTLPLALAVFT